MTHEQHVIFGTGPVGCWIARALHNMNLPTRAINRTGHRPVLMPAKVEMVAANAVDLVIEQLLQNELGVPANPKELLFDGHWVEGTSLCARKPTRL